MDGFMEYLGYKRYKEARERRKQRELEEIAEPWRKREIDWCSDDGHFDDCYTNFEED